MRLAGWWDVARAWMPVSHEPPDNVADILEALRNKMAADETPREEIRLLLTLQIAARRPWLVSKYGRSWPRKKILNRALRVAMRVLADDFIATVGCVCADLDVRVAEGKEDGGFRAESTWLYGPQFELVGRLNTPGSYNLLAGYLGHPWPEIRDSAAWRLRMWRGQCLADRLCEALLMGREDPVAPEHSFHLLLLIGRLRDPRSLPALESLVGTDFDRDRNKPGGGPLANMLREAMAACSGG